MARAKLTDNQIIEIFGKKVQTPDECILKIAMEGLSFTASMLIRVIKFAALELSQSNDDYIGISTSTTVPGSNVLVEFKTVRNSQFILGNVARIIKYTTEFNKALKSKKTVISRLQSIGKQVIHDNMDKYRYTYVSDMYDAIREIISLIQAKDLNAVSKKQNILYEQ